MHTIFFTPCPGRTIRPPIRRWVLVVLLSIGMTLGAAMQVHAQGYISPMIGYDFGGDAGCPTLTDCEDTKVNVSVSAGAMGSLFGVEGEIAYAPDFFGDAPGRSSSVLTAMGNLMLVPRLGPVRPYVLAGIGLIKTHVELTTASVFTTDDNHAGWNVGGGVIGFLGDHVGVRGDLRYFHSFQDLTILGLTLGDTKLDYGRASIGAVLKF